nr:purple acid phosphatase 22-like [Ipomoea batatas]GME18491.1 purple acid phosphatase 22-like [Ipomoea batatas]
MDKWLSLFFPILLTAFLLQYSDASPEYSRPHPRRLIFTTHHRAESDPQQVHISLAGKDHMRVSWVTSDKHGESVVEYGKAPGRCGGSGPEFSFRTPPSTFPVEFAVAG